MDNWSQLEGTRFLPFRIYLCLLPRHLSPKMYGFLSVQRLLLSFVCPRTPTVYHLHDFLPPGPTPISLLIPSHLPAGTVFCAYYLFLIFGVLNWHQKKIFFLTSCYRCFYILVKLFLYGIVLKMEKKKRKNSCSILLKHLAISIFMMKFSSDRTKHCNGTSQILNPSTSSVFNLKLSYHILKEAYSLPFTFQNLVLLNPQLSLADLIILAKCFFLIQLVVHLSLLGI